MPPNDESPITQAGLEAHEEFQAIRERLGQTKPPPPPGSEYVSPKELLKRWKTIGTEAREAVMWKMRSEGDPTGVLALMRLKEKGGR